MKRGTLLRSKSGFDSRRGFRFGVVVKQDHGTLASSSPGGGTRRLHRLGATILKDSPIDIFAGFPPQSALAGHWTRRGRGPVRYEVARPKRRGAGLSASSLRGETAITARFERASPGSIPGEGSISCPGGVTAACLSYKEKDLVRFKAGEPFSGLSVTEAYSPRTGEAEVRLLQPRPIRGIGREGRHPASTRNRGERYPYPAPFRRCSPTEEAPRSERG